LRSVLIALSLVACNTGTAPVASDRDIPAQAQDPHPLNLNYTQGYSRSAHVEVAPGVFILADLVATGRYRVTTEAAADRARAADMSSSRSSGTSTSTSWGDSGITSDSGTWEIPSCGNWDLGSYNDSLRRSSELFDDPVSWSTHAAVFSSGFDNGTTEHVISSGVITWAGTVEGIGSTQYVFVNDAYIGFVEDHQTDSVLGNAQTYLEVPCDDGFLDLTTFDTMYVRDGDSAIEINHRTDAYAVCCPG
jgi:hypothetical protein